MLAAAIAGNDVVQRKMPALLSAVLAGVAVAVENFVAGHLSFPTGTPYHLGEAYDRGQLDGGADGVDGADAVLNHLRFTLEDKHHRSAGAADRKRLVALVQDQYRMVNHELSFKRDYAYFTAKLLGVARRGETITKKQETITNQ